MNRNEMRNVAEGLKAARPIEFSTTENPHGRLEYPGRLKLWKDTAVSVADALRLDGKPRSNFLAAAGVTHQEKAS